MTNVYILIILLFDLLLLNKIKSNSDKYIREKRLSNQLYKDNLYKYDCTIQLSIHIKYLNKIVKNVCTGSFISKNELITSGHCFTNFQEMVNINNSYIFIEYIAHDDKKRIYFNNKNQPAILYKFIPYVTDMAYLKFKQHYICNNYFNLVDNLTLINHKNLKMCSYGNNNNIDDKFFGCTDLELIKNLSSENYPIHIITTTKYKSISENGDSGSVIFDENYNIYGILSFTIKIGSDKQKLVSYHISKDILINITDKLKFYNNINTINKNFLNYIVIYFIFFSIISLY
jgi:hypothetical protein